MKTNCHTHTTYCDGTATAAELAREAAEKGFDCLGFSGHSYVPMGEEWCMSPSGAESYKREIAALREQYAGTLDILCGVEQDTLSPSTTNGYDFVIGSVHYMQASGRLFSVDEAPEISRRAITELYGGSFDAYAEEYFALVSRVCDVTGCDVIGHFDLVSKFSERLGTPESERYLSAAFAAVEKLIPYGRPFEINTGAMARGYRTAPYPSPAILRHIRRLGGSVIITSDCHRAGMLDYAFDTAKAQAREAGFESVTHLTAAGLVEEKI